MKRENREIDMNHDFEAIDTDLAVLRGRKKEADCGKCYEPSNLEIVQLHSILFRYEECKERLCCKLMDFKN